MFLKILKDSRGFSLIFLMATLAIMPLMILVTVTSISAVNRLTRTAKTSQTRTITQLTKAYLIQTALDPDGDAYHELLKDADSALPLSIPLNGMDQWGTPLRYCTWDLGTANSNTLYSQNTTTPPLSNLIGRLISAGSDKTFQTNCGDAPAGDDVIEDIYELEARGSTGALTGWKKLENAVVTLSPLDFIGIGTDTPPAQLTVDGTTRGHDVGGGVIQVQNSSLSFGPQFRIKSVAPSGRDWSVGTAQTSDTAGQGSFYIRDNTANADRVVVDADGNVGVGKVPEHKLDVQGQISASDGVLNAVFNE